ncbi:MAG: Serine-type D-Ala-D-Ala carboxypeptidase [Clostridiales bacterium]|nr:Serine-type D-Ala-D-Ala carboxypeptidase [Clostridiales bacterium]
MKKLICIVLSICFAIIPCIEADTADDDLKLHARAALLMDGDSGRVLWEENGYETRAMASTTKIMTCLITIETCDLDEIVTVSKKASQAPDVQLNINKGEQYILRDLLYALMLESSNDVAIAIAEHVYGNVDIFCNKMTERALQIGAINTSYKTPNGLDAKGHYSTAFDLALITREALKNEQLVEIINTKSYSFKDVKNKRQFSVNNRNNFLDMMDGAIGVKTGYTGEAGYCFVGAVKKDNKYFISVVLGSGWPPQRSYKWKDTLKIMMFGDKNFDYEKIFDNNIVFENISVVNGQINSTQVYMTGSLGLLLKDEEEVEIRINIPEELTAPVEIGTVVGSVDIYIDSKLYTSYDIVTATAVAAIDYKFCFDKVLNKWLGSFQKIITELE